MKIFIPSKKSEKPNRTKPVKSDFRRKRRKEDRNRYALEIDRMIEARNQKELSN